VGALGKLPRCGSRMISAAPLISRGTESSQTRRWRRQSRANSSLKANSLLAGKIQGTSSILASGVRITDRNYDEDQCFTGKFPTQRNRELIVP